jgi:hypothetical protein
VSTPLAVRDPFGDGSPKGDQPLDLLCIPYDAYSITHSNQEAAMQVPVVVALASPDGRVKFFDDSALYVAAEWAEDEGGHGRTRTYLGFGSESWCMV